MAASANAWLAMVREATRAMRSAGVIRRMPSSTRRHASSEVSRGGKTGSCAMPDQSSSRLASRYGLRRGRPHALERRTVAVDGARHVGGETPLACDRAPDIDAIRTALASDVDLADGLASISSPTDLTVGCARYRASSIRASNTLTLHIEGDTSLRVGSPVKIRCPKAPDRRDV